MVKIKQQLVSTSVANRVTTRGTNTKRYLIIHETANISAGANATAHSRLQANGNSRVASWHYQVDDREVIQSFSDDYICWHAGTAFYNQNGIGIELCVNSDGDFNKTLQNGAALIKHLMKKHNIPSSRVVTHQASSGKLCPRFLLTGTKGVTWNQFKSMIASSSSTATPSAPRTYLIKGDTGAKVREMQQKLQKSGYKLDIDGIFGVGTENVIKKFQKDYGLDVDGIAGKATLKKLNEIYENKKGELTMSQYNELKGEINKLKERLNGNRDVSDSHKKGWEWSEKKGLLNGDNPSRHVTREQLATILNRYSESNSLSHTAEQDLVKLFQEAYDNDIFSVDHTDRVESISEHEIINYLVSVVARMLEEKNK